MEQLFYFALFSLFVPSLCQKSDWIKELLDGVDSVNQHGIPGGIHTWTERTSAIITAPGDPSKIIMAAAKLGGKGRIIVFSHSNYGKEFLKNEGNLKLNSNIRRWLTRGKRDNPEDVVDLNNYRESLSTSKIYTLNSRTVSPDRAREVLTFVRDKGGAFVEALVPWSKKKDSVNLDILYAEAGLSWNPVYVKGIDGKYPISQSRGTDVLPIEVALQKLESNPETIVERHGRYIADGFRFGPTGMVNALMNRNKNVLKPLLDLVKKDLPSSKNKVRSSLGRGAISLTGAILSNDVMATKKIKAPGYEIFPGTVPSSARRRIVVFEVKAVNKNERHPTGHYVAAGEYVTIKLISGDTSNWNVRIGAHTDNLSSKDEYRRYPVLLTVRPLKDGMKIHTPFGGLLHLENRLPDGDTIKIEVTGLVEAPFYDLRTTTHSKWLTSTRHSRKAPAPWAEFVANGIIITLPSESIRNIDNPEEVMRIHEKVVKGQHHLRGTDWMNEKFERIVTDAQLSAGYMHSGYPIGTKLDVANPSNRKFLLNAANMKINGTWGLWHELGHNKQLWQWTFSGSGEVTNNIFTLYCNDIIAGMSPFKVPWLQKQYNKMKTYLNDPQMAVWKKQPGVALGIYAQFAENFGWEAFKQFFRRFETDNIRPKDDQEKIDGWLTVMSSVVEKDLSPMFKFWGISVSSNAFKEAAKSGKPFLPDDELTKLSSSRVSTILRSYPSAERQAKKMKDRTDPNAKKSVEPAMKIISSKPAPVHGYYYQEQYKHLEGMDRKFSVDTEELLAPRSCGGRG